MPSFDHSFEPIAAAPVGASAELTAREIEDAGLFEVLQTPGAALGSWAILDALLDRSQSKFVFREPLGHSREVKTALSGLFGRFVARAYLSKYLGYSFFAPITRPPMRISRLARAEVVRLSRGDMPDWVIWKPGWGSVAIAEAKGCHDRQGAGAALSRAWTQAHRADVNVGGHAVPLKRYAIATRWGFSTPYISSPILSVRDPDEPNREATPEEMRDLGVGIARLHVAALLRSLGYIELSTQLNAVSTAAAPGRREEALARCRHELQIASKRILELPSSTGRPKELLGSFVTRAGLLQDILPADRLTLQRLALRPTFVGVDSRLVRAVIEADLDLINLLQEMVSTARDRPEALGRPLNAEAGLWSVRFGEDEANLI